MTLTVAVLALIHGIPVFAAFLIWRSRKAVVLAALLMSVVAIAVGGPQYALFDLLAIAVASYLCYPRVAAPEEPVEAAPAPPQRTPNSYDGKGDGVSAVLVVVALAIGYFLYGAFAPKPAPPAPKPPAPSLSSRLQSSIAALSSERANKAFPLIDAGVEGSVLYLEYRSTAQAAVAVKAQHAKTNFVREYSKYYCSSPVFGPLLADGAKIQILLTGKDARVVGTYAVAIHECSAR